MLVCRKYTLKCLGVMGNSGWQLTLRWVRGKNVLFYCNCNFSTVQLRLFQNHHFIFKKYHLFYFAVKKFFFFLKRRWGVSTEAWPEEKILRLQPGLVRLRVGAGAHGHVQPRAGRPERRGLCDGSTPGSSAAAAARLSGWGSAAQLHTSPDPDGGGARTEQRARHCLLAAEYVPQNSYGEVLIPSTSEGWLYLETPSFKRQLR